MDYQKLGLKCGLEIHQQLETSKLFCSCPGSLREDKPDFVIKRELRAVAGEHGEIDVAALHEQLKGKYFLYEGYHDNNCLVELDEEPPHPMNEEALGIGLQVCLMMNCQVPDVVEVMRKTVVDGSNTAGFQRTALIGRNGSLKINQGEVSIQNISIEEDAARIIKEEKDHVVYRLDRLGMAELEIGTGPDLKTPEQVKEAAEKIGMILRSTGKARRGLGTIRQDVNVSIAGGARIEIKLVQDLKLLPKLVGLEVLRQVNLLEMAKKLKGKKLKKEVIDVSEIFKNSESKIIKQAPVVFGLKLDGFKGEMGKEVQPNRRLGTEFSDRAKVKAGVGGIFHSDELPNYGITGNEVEAVKKKLKCREGDGFVLVADTSVKAERALEAVFERAEEALKGVPKEVRKAREDGTTSYMRPMPGAARMYPETDIPLVRPDLREIKLPELIEEKTRRFEKMGLGRDLAPLIARSKKAELFEALVGKYTKIKPAFIAETLTGTLLELKRDYDVEPEKLSDEDLRKVFSYLDEGKIHKDIMLSVLVDMAKGQFDIKKYESLETEDLHKDLIEVIKENKGAPFGALMGRAMAKLKGKASGEKISKMLKELLEKGH